MFTMEITLRNDLEETWTFKVYQKPEGWYFEPTGQDILEQCGPYPTGTAALTALGEYNGLNE